MRTSRRIGLGIAVLLLAAGIVVGVYSAIQYGRSLWLATQILDSGGPLRPLQAAYDVRRLDLSFDIDPAKRRLGGRGRTTVAALAPLDRFEIQLDQRFEIATASVDGRAARFRHAAGLVTVTLEPPWTAGERHAVELAYAGRPKRSPKPPWIDGFVWERTPSGAPWIGVTCEGDGADDWWPAKDHPSDEPDEGFSIELTIPDTPRDLVGLANGHRVSERVNADGSSTSRWESRHPINNYLVTIAAAPYVEVVERYRGADGTLDEPMIFYALPEHREAARAMWREAPGILASFARRFGEFPFLDDKIAVVDSPMSGMEHQTLIAYGDDFLPDDSGIDETLVHELAHEWWGNKISVSDWDDFWIQEGFATYAEVLYVEERLGAENARAYLERFRDELDNREPLVAGRPRTAAEAYSNDLYGKGAWVLATLRWQLGDEAFFRVLRRYAGEAPDACRLTDTAELARFVAEESGRDLDWFWRRLLREAKPPVARIERSASANRVAVELAWDDPRFELTLPVLVDGALRRVEMPRGRARLELPATSSVALALEGRVFAEAKDGEADDATVK